MPIQPQLIPVQFAGGIESKQDSKLVLPGKLTKLENGVFEKGGVGSQGELLLSIIKRNGYRSLGKTLLGGDDISSGDALNVFRDELLLFDSGSLYSYAPSIDSWSDKGRVVPITSQVSNVVRNSREQTQADSAIVATPAGGVIVYAWKDSSGGVRASVIDEASGTPFQSDALLSSTGQHPKCIEIAGYLYVIYVEGTTYKQRRLNPVSPLEFEAAVSISADVHGTTKHHDIVKFNAHSAVFAYRNTGGDLKIAYLNSEGAEGTTVDGFPNAITVAESPTNCLAVLVNPASFDIIVAYHNATDGLRAASVTQGFIEVFAPMTVDATTSPVFRNVTGVFTSETAARFYYESNETLDHNHLILSNSVSATGVAGTRETFKRSVGIASKAFRVNEVTYLNVVHVSTLQTTYFTCREDGSVIGKSLYGIAGGFSDGATLPQVLTLSTGERYYAAGIKARLVSEDDSVFTLRGVCRIALDFDSIDRYFAAELGKNSHIVGGFLSNYDGLSVTEHGFHLYPENLSATPAATTGSMSDGTYQYAAIWEWVDNQGQIHRSAPSVPLSVTLSGGGSSQKVTLSVPTLRLTAKTAENGRAEAVIAVYRTENGGSIFYRTSSITSPTYNDTSVDSVSVVDTISDASLVSHEILYTTGGVLDNESPPACALIAASKNRAFLTGLEDDECAVEYSRAQVDGEGLSFNRQLRKKVESVGGRNSAICVMDEKIIIFKASRIYAFAGDGPTDSGAQDNFSEPELVTSDVGCEEPNSIALIPAGVMFKSGKGIYLLTRSLGVEYVGAAVEELNTLTVTSADVLTDKNQVRFITSDGVTLVYDYYFKQWSTFTNHEGKDSVLWQGSYVYLRNNFGTLYKEEPEHFLDDTVGFSLKIATAWIKMGGLQGFQRVQRAIVLGDYKSEHVLRARVGYDYSDSYDSDYVFLANEVLESTTYGDDPVYGDATIVYGSDADDLYQFEMHLERQKCQAIRFEFEDVMSETVGQSYSLTQLALLVGLKRGTNKVRSEKRI